ncbi:MAG: glutamate--tRNA ligase [Candidatus Latescibacteria bacterium 4484_7]|nr:MAG: glutamate--tRNA ligase [Candidatus Latescibacteria bacterium 4484_7]
MGGGYGPYRQSERLGIYREYSARLVEEGKAYPCFCTEEELARKKEEMIRKGKPPHYDGTCRDLTERERAERRREGRPESIRFRVDECASKSLDDIIRGEVVFPAGMVGDFVIMRSNGHPTYNFAAAVDDALMEITHVIRGEEHLSNTLRQIMIYDALGLEMPRFAHIPLILAKDRSKLSKRHGAPNIKDFRLRGYPPEAVANYLAFLGWSPKSEKEILSIGEMVEEFSLDRVSQSPSIFDETKLNWVSAQHIKRGGVERYFEEAKRFFPEEMKEAYSHEALIRVFEVLSENLHSLSRIPEEAAPFMPGVPKIEADKLHWLEGREDLLRSFIDEFSQLDRFNRQNLKGALKKVSKGTGAKGKDLYMPLRVAVTGSEHGPDILSILEVKGRERVVSLLENALNLVA